MDLAVHLDAALSQDYPQGTLYLVATPIGNLADLSLRAIAVLMQVDRVAAEDTRSAKRVLGHLGLDKPCIALHRHNERSVSSSVIAALRTGERVAYVCDAGTPAISDPGAKLVESVRSAGYRIIPLPGPNAAVCALSAAGFAQTAFYFAGFLPARAAQAERALASWVDLPAHIVLYEAPQRVLTTVGLIARLFGPRRHLFIARELTKLFESLERLPLGEAETWLRADPNRQRGEFVLIVEGLAEPPDELARALPVLERLLACLPLSEAVALTVDLTGVGRKELYARALELKGGG